MPLYEFTCPQCGHQREAVRSLEASPPQCICGQLMERRFPSNILIKWKYPMWVDRIDDIQKRQVDEGKEPTLPHPSEVL